MAADKPGLAKQDLATLDVSTLNPLSPEVISRQATINIGARRRPPVSAGRAGDRLRLRLHLLLRGAGLARPCL